MSQSIPSAAAAAMLLAVLAFANTASAQNAAPAPARSPEKTSAPSQSSPSQGIPEDSRSTPGLKVHGHWSITIKNADGTIASRHEFENSLTAAGSSTIVSLLGGSIAPGGIAVLLSPDSVSSAICTNSPCILVPSINSGIGLSSVCGNGDPAHTICIGGLAIASGLPALQLSGQVQAVQSGTITSVATQMVYCYSSSQTPSPSQCSGTQNSSVVTLTSTSSATNPAFTPVAVGVGQILQVTVTISFS